MIAATINWDDFAKVDMRAGTIIKAEPFPLAKKPSYKLWVDLGELGIKRSSAQITIHYSVQELIGRQVLCVVNFPPRQIANFVSEILVTGFPDESNYVVLTGIDKTVPNGARMF
jgi:tRNA-binding protein